MTRPNRRGPWLPDEDETLLKLVCSQGPNNWVRISQHMQHRSPKQCRERYHQNLKPSLNHDPISSQEGELIEQMVSEMGKRWAEIARRLRNRSDNAVKNWWNGSMNRRKRNVLQHAPGGKGVGNRLQPIPAAKPVANPTDRADRRPRHPDADTPYEHDWAAAAPHGSQRWRHPVLPAFRHPVLHGGVTHAARRHPSPPDAFLSLSAPPDCPRDPPRLSQSRYLPSLNQLCPSDPWSSQPHAPAARHLGEQASRPPLDLPDDRGGPTSFLLTLHPSHELAFPSPVATEVSHAPSLDRAPSLVSDDQSTCSISPKTVPSPRPAMPAPIDTDMQAWARPLSDRRDSAATILPHQKSHGKVPTDEGYVSAFPPSAGADLRSSLPLPGQGFFRYDSVDQVRPGQRGFPCIPRVSCPGPVESGTTLGAGPGSKDARMDLSNLLG